MQNTYYLIGRAPRSSAELQTGRSDGLSLFRKELPPIPVSDESYSKNSEVVRGMVAASIPTAVISSFISETNFDFGVGRGQLSQISNDAPSWDYLISDTTYEKHKYRIGEDAGNFNYGVIAYTLMSGSLDSLGITKKELRSAGLFVGSWVFSLIGGLYQLSSDFWNWEQNPGSRDAAEKLFLGKDRNWYFEEVRDAEVIQQGFRYGEFLESKRNFKKFGIELDAENFGFGEHRGSYRLMEDNLFEKLKYTDDEIQKYEPINETLKTDILV